MHLLFAWLFRGLIYLLCFFFRGIVTFFSFMTTSTIGSIITFGISFFFIVNALVDWVNDMVMSFLPTPAKDYDLSLAKTFSDLLDHYLFTLLDNSPWSMVVRDVLYIVNFGALIEGILEIFFPFLLSIWFYKTVKSWLPTLSS